MKGKIKKPTKSESNSGSLKTLIYIGILFVCYIFLVSAWTLTSEYIKLVGRYRSDMGWQTFILIYPLGALLYFVGIAGLLLRRELGYYIGLFLIFLNVLLSIVAVTSIPLTGMLNLLFNVIAAIILIKSRGHLNPFSENDATVGIVFIILIFLWFGAYIWGINQPKPDEIIGIVVKEAMEKNDAGLCDKLEAGRDECVRQVAENKQDYRLCELIVNDYSKDRCYLHIADSTKNPELCEFIKDEYDRGLCNGFFTA